MAYKRKVSYTQGARRVRRGKKRAEKTKIGEKKGGAENGGKKKHAFSFSGRS